jgi:hypothetical protein
MSSLIGRSKRKGITDESSFDQGSFQWLTKSGRASALPNFFMSTKRRERVMEKLLPITIKGAKVTSLQLKFEDELKWNAEVTLMMENDSRLTSIWIGNDCWDEKKRAELEISGYELAGQLRSVVEIAVTRKLNELHKQIGMEVA